MPFSNAQIFSTAEKTSWSLADIFAAALRNDSLEVYRSSVAFVAVTFPTCFICYSASVTSNERIREANNSAAAASSSVKGGGEGNEGGEEDDEENSKNVLCASNDLTSSWKKCGIASLSLLRDWFSAVVCVAYSSCNSIASIDFALTYCLT